MEFRVLGRLEVLRDGVPVDLGAFRQRALLGLLLTSPNSVWSTDQIIDGLWGDEVGADKQNALWVYVSGLRKALEPDRKPRTDGTVLLTRSPGYLIEADPDSIDSVRFERLVAEGRALLHADPASASLVLGEALTLWRGHAFEDFTYESFAQGEISRLEELRIEAVEARIEADLDRGLSRELVSELQTLARQHPLREELTAQLMLALHRTGRQAEALRAYQHLKSRLGDELGIEPSTRLRLLHEQIVIGDTALEVARGAQARSVARPGLAVRGYELREQIGQGAFGVAYRAFQPAVGREVAIKVIRPELANDPGFIRRFEAEAQLVARLEHPHIVPLYDYWREPDAAYLVMRLMRGGTLADVLAGGAMPLTQAASVVKQLASALDAAHRAGVVHRDIKPTNILIDDEGNAYLSDFGIAVGDDGQPAGDGSVVSTLTVPFSSPEQIDHGPVTASTDIYSLGVVMAQVLTGLQGGIGEIRGALPPSAQVVIERATDVNVARRYDRGAVFAADLHDALDGGHDSPPEPEVVIDNPYKGLRPFDAADAGDFFGRERLIERLVARLGTPGGRGRFVAVVGPSGSGKSSVVKAGLVPALRNDALPDSSRWFTVVMTPGPYPFEALEEALLSVAVDPPASLLELLVGSSHGLDTVLRSVLAADGSQLLLVIDQFEELFTQGAPSVTKLFLDMLVDAVTTDHSRLRVVVTLRADFYDRPLHHSGLGELLRDGTQIITPMTPKQLERAITGPVEALGVRFEPALVAELVRDVLDRASALPLLQYALAELFDHRRGTLITDAAYRELGGVSGALVRRADGLLAGLHASARDATRQIFLRLVTLGEGDDDTRRRILRSELEQLAVDRGDVQSVLKMFGRHRLLSFDRDPVTRSPTVEISHESMLTEWTRLRDWVDSARDDVRNQRRLAEAMHEWDGRNCDPDFLLRGGRLEQLHGWSRTTDLPLSNPEQAFLDASVADRNRAADEERDRERRTNRRLRRMLTVAVCLIVVAITAGLFAFSQRQRADQARRDAEITTLENRSLALRSSQRDAAGLLAVEAAKRDAEITTLANRSLALRSSQRDAAGLLAVEAAKLRADGETRSALFGTFSREPGFLGYHTYDGARIEGAVIPGANAAVITIASPSPLVDDTPLRRVDLATGQLGPPFDPTLSHASVRAVAVSSDGRVAVAYGVRHAEDGDDSADLVVFDITTGGVIGAPIAIPGEQAAYTVALNSNGSRVALAGGVDGEVQVFDPETGERLVLIEAPGDLQRSGRGRDTAAAGWAPNGQLYVGSSGSHLREFDPVTFELVRDISVPLYATGGLLKFSDDGAFVVTRGVNQGDDGSQTGSAARIDLTDGTTAWTIPPGEYGFGKCDSVAFSAPEGRLWCGDYFGVIRGRSLDTGELDGTKIEHQRGWLSGLDVIDVDGERYLVSLGRNAASIGRWQVDGDGPITHVVGSGNAFASYSPDGRWMLVGGPADGPIGFSTSVWDVDNERETIELPKNAFDVTWVDDNRLASITENGLAQLIDVRTGEKQDVDLDIEPGWQAIARVADGRIALGYPDGHLDIYDVDGGQVPLRLQITNADWSFQVGVNQIAASTDGTRIYATGLGLYQFDAVDGRQSMRVPDTAIGTVAVSSDGLVATGRVDGTINLLDSDDLSVQGTLAGARGGVSSLHFSADGRYLLAMANDGTMSLYDVDTRQRLGDAVDVGEADADLRPDGLQAAVAHYDASGITLWNLDPAALADATCRVAGRNLTRAEWDTYIGDLGSYRATCPQFALPR